MTRESAVVMVAVALLLLQGCTTHCRGNSCARPASSPGALVIWWPPHMRVETGTETGRPDHQVVPLEQ